MVRPSEGDRADSQRCRELLWAGVILEFKLMKIIENQRNGVGAQQGTLEVFRKKLGKYEKFFSSSVEEMIS
jgi:hypothetical protein